MVGMKGLAPPRLPDSESGPSAIRVKPHARKLVHPAGLPPADSPFEAEDDNNFTTDAEGIEREDRAEDCYFELSLCRQRWRLAKT